MDAGVRRPRRLLALTREQVQRLRARSQLLAGPRKALEPGVILGQVVALQAQVAAAAGLGLRARGKGLRAEDVALSIKRGEAVRGWLMRGTLHIVAREDFRWLVRLLGPLSDRPSKRRLDLGLDPETMARGLAAIRKILGARGPLSRAGLVEELARSGLPLDARSQAPAHLVAHCGLQGLICFGPPSGRAETYVLVDDWLPPAVSIRFDPWPELGRRYVRAYGPAGPRDFAAWSGASLGQAAEAFRQIGPELDEVEIESGPALVERSWRARTRRAGNPSVRLLPEFDTYLLGYRNRDFALAPKLERYVQRGGGWIHRVAIAEGRGIAAWEMARAGRKSTVTMVPFEELSEPVSRGLSDEAADVGRFLGVPAVLEIDAVQGG